MFRMDESRLVDVQKVLVRYLSIEVFYDVKTRSSFCWKYFGNLVMCRDGDEPDTIVDSDKVFCLACLMAIKMESEDVTFGSVNIKSYKRSVSTGNLTRHLREVHMIMEECCEELEHEPISAIAVLEPPPPKRRKTKKTSNFVDAAVWTDPEAREFDKSQLTTDIALWFCRALMPIEYLSDGMADFLKKYDVIRSESDLPTRDAVSTTMEHMYEGILSLAKTQASYDLQHHAFTFDTWADRRRGLNYITATLHSLTTDFDLNTINVSTQVVDDYTGNEIQNIIHETRKLWCIAENQSNTVHVVTRAEKNIEKVLVRDNFDLNVCLGHGFHNLVIVDGIKSIPEIKSLVLKCKKLLNVIAEHLPVLEGPDGTMANEKEFLSKISSVAAYLEGDENDPIPDNDSTEDIDSNQKKQQTSPGRLLRIECVGSTATTVAPTRWQLVLEILKCLVKVSSRDQFRKCIKSLPSAGTFTKNDWLIVEELLNFLSKFREVVEVLLSQQACTINVALLFRSEIKDILESTDNESPIIQRMKKNMLANIDNRLPVTRTIVTAALLDNRFIGLKEIDVYLNSMNTTRAAFLAQSVRKVLNHINLPSSEAEGSDEEQMQETSLLHKLVVKHRVNSDQEVKIKDPIERECWLYFAMANQTEPKDGDLLRYWRNKREEFHWLGTLARALLCVPATSTPADRMFSVAGIDFSTKRSRINPCKLNKLMFIHDNWKNLNNPSVNPNSKNENGELDPEIIRIKTEVDT